MISFQRYQRFVLAIWPIVFTWLLPWFVAIWPLMMQLLLDLGHGDEPSFWRFGELGLVMAAPCWRGHLIMISFMSN